MKGEYFIVKLHYQNWLNEADKDFRYASWSLENAEKYLKAYIVFKNLPFKKIHELPELLATIRAIDQSFAEIEEEAIFRPY